MSIEPQDVGSTLRGGYRVIDVLKGGMGVVYICHQDSTNQLYALKTVRFDGPRVEIERLEERFQVEVNHWIHISREKPCDQVVTALAFDADERLLILEFVDGLPLHVLASEQIPAHPVHAIAWARDIAVGMRLLHNDFRLVHRDLKPQNILISRKNLTAKITDLGIGKVLRDDAATGTLVGTPAFMPPESFSGKADFRSDIYAFGATFFWMLTGEHAIALEGALERALPERVLALLGRCLNADPERRYPVFDELMQDLYELDPIEAFDVDSSHYLHCEKHEFFSPRFRGSEEQCLFCRQEEDLERQKTVSLELASQKKKRQEATSFLAGDLVGDSVDAGVSVVDTRPDSAVQSGAPDVAPVQKDAARASWAKLVGAIVAVVAVGTGLGLWLGADDPSDSPRPAVERPPTGGSPGAAAIITAGVSCGVVDCKRPVAVIPQKWFDRRQEFGEAVHVWTPEYCPEHSPHVCAACGARSREGLSDDFPCSSCGGALSERE